MSGKLTSRYALWKLSVIVMMAPWILSGCESSVGPKELPGGDWTVGVSVLACDEFGLPARVTGPIVVTLTGEDRSVSVLIAQGDSSCKFTNLPLETYMVRAEKSGFYPAYAPADGTLYGSLSASPRLVPRPSPAMRIDSLETHVNTITPRVSVRLITAQTVPKGGSRYAVLFAALNPQVGPRFGDYVFALTGLIQAEGSSEILTDDTYHQMHDLGIASGTRVYITARLATLATGTSTDPLTGLQLFTNLEENTHAVVSFIMP